MTIKKQIQSDKVDIYNNIIIITNINKINNNKIKGRDRQVLII